MTNARTSVDVVGAKRGAHQFLHQISFFVGATRGSDTTDRVFAVFGLDAFELGGRMVEGFVPADFLPWVGDLGANHRLGDAVLMRGIAPSETAFHT